MRVKLQKDDEDENNLDEKNKGTEISYLCMYQTKVTKMKQSLKVRTILRGQSRYICEIDN